jgi:hypothetical protein
MSLLDKLHNMSLRVLTLCGIGAVLSLAVNMITAVAMFVGQHKQK